MSIIYYRIIPAHSGLDGVRLTNAEQNMMLIADQTPSRLKAIYGKRSHYVELKRSGDVHPFIKEY